MEPAEPFDIVVCENWLGTAEHERRLFKKLGRLVADGGLLIVTSTGAVARNPLENTLRFTLSFNFDKIKKKDKSKNG